MLEPMNTALPAPRQSCRYLHGAYEGNIFLSRFPTVRRSIAGNRSPIADPRMKSYLLLQELHIYRRPRSQALPSPRSYCPRPSSMHVRQRRLCLSCSGKSTMGMSWMRDSCARCRGSQYLLVFHVYCDAHNIPEEKRYPTSPYLLLAFLSSCAGSYSGSALANYAAALRAWHLLHGRAWLISHNELKAMLDGASALAPPSSKCPKRAPFMPPLYL